MQKRMKWEEITSNNEGVMMQSYYSIVLPTFT